jgi:hypothetical protein
MVVAEIAAASVLLVASGLLIRSFLHVLDVQLGYRPEQAMSMRVDPPRKIQSDTAANAYYDEILRRVRAIPGVSHASLGDLLPFGGDRSWSVAGEGQTYPRDQKPEAFIRVVGTDWLGAMGITAEAGRDFNAGDGPGAPNVVIVNETLARTLWPGRDAIGQNIQNRGILLRVVGVIADVRHDALERKMTSELYFPMRQYMDYSAVQLVVRTTLSSSELARAVRRTLEPVSGSR